MFNPESPISEKQKTTKKQIPKADPIPTKLKTEMEEYFAKRSAVQQKMTKFVMSYDDVGIARKWMQIPCERFECDNPRSLVLSYIFDTITEFALTECAGTSISDSWYDFITNNEVSTPAKLHS